jgi:type I restriction enzyme S subunit
MNNWVETTLKKVSDKIDYGYTASATHQNTGVKFLRITDIVPSSINWESVPFCEVSEKDLEKNELQKNDIVIARTGATVGYAKLIGEGVPRSVFASYLIRVKIKDGVSKKFIGVLVESSNYKYFINTIAGGAAQPNANARDLCSFPFFLPPLQVQNKIAAVLSAYDDLIENNKRRIALLEKMAEEIYREWFVRMRFPGHEKAKFEKGVPEGWEQKPSNEVLDVLSGGTPKTDVPVYWDGHIPFFTPKDAADNFYVLNTEKYITENGLRTCNSRLYKKDTIFITARGTVGKLVLANRNMAMNQSCYALLPKSGRDVYFYFLAIKTALSYIKGVSKSGVFDNIIVDTFKVVPILMPTDELVKRFNELIRPLFQQTATLLQENEVLVETRNRLLPRLISGKLSVENLDIQLPPSMQDEASS